MGFGFSGELYLSTGAKSAAGSSVPRFRAHVGINIQRSEAMVTRTIGVDKRISVEAVEAAWPSGQRVGLAIRQCRVRVPLWPLPGFDSR